MMKWQRWHPVQGLLVLAMVAVLAGVFWLYRQPGFVVPLSDFFWGCA
jgi:hypothetical protein